LSMSDGRPVSQGVCPSLLIGMPLFKSGLSPKAPLQRRRKDNVIFHYCLVHTATAP
jgi:hypothetical protein